MSRRRDALAVALADFRERSRSSTLLAVPVLIASLAKVVAIDSTLVLDGEFTGVPTAAWYGGMVAGLATTVLLVFGYPLVNGSLLRDREANVAELVATSPLSNASYLVGKWLSNLAVLTVATAVLAASTAVAFALQGTGPFDAVGLLAPFALVTLPTMAVVAAASVCFETTRLLRGTAGTALYFALALGGVMLSIVPESPMDLAGVSLVRDSMASSLAAQYPGFEPPIAGFAYTDQPAELRTFEWSGLALTPASVASRLPVVGAAAVLLGLAAVSFDRFDDTGGWSLPALGGRGSDEGSEAASGAELSADLDDGEPVDADPADAASLAPATTGGFAFGRVLAAEFRMMVRGRRRAWYVGCAVGLAATLLAPLGALRSVVVPVALLLALPAWSGLGSRERRHRTSELVFVDTDPTRLLGASYLSGLGLGVGLVAPALVRFALAGSWTALLGAVAGLAFLPAAALAAGVWSGRQSPFEIAYLVAWYVGPMNGAEPLDYVGAHPTTSSPGVPVAYLALAVLALGLAVVGRYRRLGS
ncbi:ABC transporter permease [Halorussus halobius]|uniref:ABC transporter permease n=1 Tax=Halorussus halobius TaxID=1710537 RepID=UPI0010932CBB|nr:hypothetical protein [Halorussus halobius]